MARLQIDPETGQPVPDESPRPLPAEAPPPEIPSPELVKLLTGITPPATGTEIWPQAPADVVSSTINTLQDHQDLNFVQRVLDPSQFPILERPDLGPGHHSTHLMASGEFDGKQVAYPTVIQPVPGGPLKWLKSAREAADYARRTGEYIEFPDQKSADAFADNGYKVGLGAGMRRDTGFLAQGENALQGLMRSIASPEGRADVASAAKAGAIGSIGTAQHLAENVTDLALRGSPFTPDQQQMEQNPLSVPLMKAAAAARRPGIAPTVAEIVAGLPVNLAIAAGASAAGGPILGFGGLSYLQSADKPPIEQATDTGMGIVLGTIFQGVEGLPRAIKAPVIGGATYGASRLAGADQTHAATEALAFGGLSAMGGRRGAESAARPALIEPSRPPEDVATRAELDQIAGETPQTPPEVAPNIPGNIPAEPNAAPAPQEPPVAHLTAQERLASETARVGRAPSVQLSDETGAIGGSRNSGPAPTPGEIEAQGALVESIRSEFSAKLASGEDLTAAIRGRLNASKFPDDVANERRAILQVAGDQYASEVAAQQRGTVPIAETQAQAAAIFGIRGPENVARWLARTPGMNAESAADLSAMQMYTTALMDHVYELDKVIGEGADTTANQAALIAATHRLGEMVSTTTGANAEAGRSLNILRQMRAAATNARALADALRTAGPGANINLIRSAIQEAKAARLRGDTAGELPTLMAATRPSTVDKIVEAIQSIALTAPPSHIANFKGNAALALYAPLERSMAGIVGSVRQAGARVIGGKAAAARVRQDRTALGEGVELALGGISAVTDLARAVAEYPFARPVEAIRNEATLTGQEPATGQIERARLRATLRSPTSGGGSGSKFQETRGLSNTGVVGKILQPPFWALEMGDAIFSAIADRGALYAAARRGANAEDLSGLAKERSIIERVDQAVRDRAMGRENPLVDEAHDFAKEQVLQNPLPPAAGYAAKAIQKSQGVPGLILRSAILFRNTPANVMRWAVRRVPGLNVVASVPTVQALRGKMGGRAFDEAAGRVLTGAAVSAIVIAAVEQGRLTGAFDDEKPGLASLRKARGEQEYAWVSPDGKYNSYRSLEPLASLIGTTADAWNLYKKAGTQSVQDKALAPLTYAALSLGKQMKNQSFLENAASVVLAIQDPDQYGQRFQDNLARLPIPAIFSYIANREDPWQRAASTELERLQGSLGLHGPKPEHPEDFWKAPYRSFEVMGIAMDALPPAQDFWGRPRVQNAPWLASKGPTQLRPDAVADEMVRLGLNLKDFPKKLQGTDTMIPGWDRFDLWNRSAAEAHAELSDLMLGRDGKLDPSWMEMDDAKKAEIATKMFDRARSRELRIWLEDAHEVGKISERAYQIEKHGPLEGDFRTREIGGNP